MGVKWHTWLDSTGELITCALLKHSLVLLLTLGRIGRTCIGDTFFSLVNERLL